MSTVFIAGSITIKHLDFLVQERLMNIITLGHDVVVGDADGVDVSVQRFLFQQDYQKVTVFCAGETPRNNIGTWPIRAVTTYHKAGSRAFFTAKDISMAEAANTGFMIWDTQSAGTLSNVFELLERKKNALVFLDRDKTFFAVKDAEHLEQLVALMSVPARATADKKTGLNARLTALQSRMRQFALLADSP